MYAIGEQVHVANRMYVAIGFQSMLMSPEKEFLEDEECEYACEDIQSGLRSWPGTLKRIGQEVNKRIAEHGSGSEADHDKNCLFQSVPADQDSRNPDKRDKAYQEYAGNRVEPDVREVVHAVSKLGSLDGSRSSYKAIDGVAGNRRDVIITSIDYRN